MGTISSNQVHKRIQKSIMFISHYNLH